MTPFICFIIFFAIETVWNWYIIVKCKRSPNHWQRGVFRALVFLMISVSTYEWPYWLIAFASLHGLFALPFNISLNLLRGLAWNYIGQTAWVDKLGRQWPSVYWFSQLFLFLAAIGFLTTYY